MDVATLSPAPPNCAWTASRSGALHHPGRQQARGSCVLLAGASSNRVHNRSTLTRSDAERTPEQRRYVNALALGWPELRELERRACAFIGFFRQKDASTIGLWIRAVKQTPLRAFGAVSLLRPVRHPRGHPSYHVVNLLTEQRQPRV